MGRYQEGKTNLDFSEARDSEWQWHQLGHMQVCTLLQTDNHASTSRLSFLQAGCPSCRPTNSVKTLKALNSDKHLQFRQTSTEFDNFWQHGYNLIILGCKSNPTAVNINRKQLALTLLVQCLYAENVEEILLDNISKMTGSVKYLSK